METSERRRQLKEALIAAALGAIDRHGLAGVKARELAREAGCAVGAIYNVVADLDDLILAVNSRTLAALEQRLASPAQAAPLTGPDAAIARLNELGQAYLDFAAAQTLRWRTVFEHRMATGKGVPDWYLAEQMRLFRYVEEPVGVLLPDVAAPRRALVARSLFSAVHGMVILGLEEKLQALPRDALHEQVRLVVTSLSYGLLAREKPLPAGG